MKQSILFVLVYCCVAGQLRAQQTDTLLVHFLYNQSGITAPAAHTIDSFLSANSHQFILRQIALYGHCDAIGSHVYNDSLSLTRVAAVKQYLLLKNIPASTFTKTNGFGKRQPLNSNTDEAARLLNRRVEIIIDKTPIPLPDTPKAVPVVTTTPPTLTEIIKDSATKVGSNLVLRHMNFIGGRHFLLPQSEPVLRELFQIMKDNPTLQIEIQGHVCCQPPYLDGHDADLGTEDLSIQRAKYIFQSLVKMGIDASRMRYRGFGASKKIYPTDRVGFEQEMNRRVEIKILSK